MRKSWTFLNGTALLGSSLHFSPWFLGIGRQASFCKTPALNRLCCTKLPCSVLAQTGTRLDVVLASKVLIFRVSSGSVGLWTRQPTAFEVVPHLRRTDEASVQPYPFAWGIMRKWSNPLLMHDSVPGRGGAALPAALKPIVKKQPASVEHGLNFPGKACDQWKKTCLWTQHIITARFKRLKWTNSGHPLNWFAQLFLLLFYACMSLELLKWQFQDCPQMIYRRTVLVACERNQYFSLLYICDCFFIISKFAKNIIDTSFKHSIDNTLVVCSQIFTFHEVMHV